MRANVFSRTMSEASLLAFSLCFQFWFFFFEIKFIFSLLPCVLEVSSLSSIVWMAKERRKQRTEIKWIMKWHGARQPTSGTLTFSHFYFGGISISLPNTQSHFVSRPNPSPATLPQLAKTLPSSSSSSTSTFFFAHLLKTSAHLLSHIRLPVAAALFDIRRGRSAVSSYLESVSFSSQPNFSHFMFLPSIDDIRLRRRCTNTHTRICAVSIVQTTVLRSRHTAQYVGKSDTFTFCAIELNSV